jgi:uncharacterized protein HemY
MEQEDYAQAKEHFDRSLKIYFAVNNQIEASRLLLNLGVVEQRQAHYDGAFSGFLVSTRNPAINIIASCRAGGFSSLADFRESSSS